MNSTLVAIDGNSLMNRAYYAIQRPMITKQGLYTHGVYGFLNMLAKIKKDYNPTHMVTAFDRKAPTFRHLEYEAYKAGRKKMPPELAMQMPLIKEALAAMNIKIMELDGFEADDIIGTVAKKAEQEGLSTIIITGDKDELQLASQHTSIILTRKGISEFELYDEAAMHEKYGFSPQQFIDFKGLMGDQSDGIPGLPGVGEKTAMALMQQFGSVENLLAHTDEIKNAKLRAKVEENASLAVMSKRLATIFTEVPIEVNFDACVIREPNYDDLINVYVKLEFNSLLSRLKRPSGAALSPESASEINGFGSDAQGAEPETSFIAAFELSSIQKHTIHTVQEFEAVEQSFKERAVLKVFHDNNHKGSVMIYGICLLSTNHYCYIQSDGNSALFRKIINFFAQNKTKLCGHLLQKDYYALLSAAYHGQELSDLAGEEGNIFTTEFDTAIAEYLLVPSRSQYNLSAMSMEYLKKELAEENGILADSGQLDLFSAGNPAYEEYGFLWCQTAAELLSILAARISGENLTEILQQIELPLIEVLAVMEFHGFCVDKQELRVTGDMLKVKLEELTAQIYALAGETFNINSPKQLGLILFEKLQLPSGKKTKTGYATGVEVLEKLTDEHPIIPLILEFRMYSKLNSTYVEGLLPLIGADGRIRAHFNQTVTATGRISCTEPNLQNIPIRTELGRTLRRAFVAESPQTLLVGADYSQIELRVLAHLSQDESLIQAFQSGEDIHQITAAKVFDVPEDEVTPLQRSRAKVVNFGVIYGMSEFGLASDLAISRKEAGRYIEEYFKKYNTVKEYLDSLVEQCKNNGYVTTVWNRKRQIPEIHASSYMVRQLGERLAMNTPIQGSAADIIKIAMIKVERSLMKAKLKTKLILQIHDELVLDAPIEELERAKALLSENMENAMQLRVPLESSLDTGVNWYELK